MNSHRWKIGMLVFVGIAFAFFAGCCFFSPAKKDKEQGLRGTWKYKDSYQGSETVSFRKGGDYEFDFDGDGGREVWGHYELEWNQIKFTDVGGKIMDDCKGTGIYEYNLSGNELKFNLVFDNCSSRVKSLGLLWVRKSSRP